MPNFKTRNHTEIYYKDWLLHHGGITAVECFDRARRRAERMLHLAQIHD